MNKQFEFIAKNLADTEKLAEVFSGVIDTSGVLICLYGDIGSGKTTFTKSLAKFLGITQKVTSPSFVILNEYRSDRVNLYHFDLYRLEHEGVEAILDELSEYTEKENSVTLIEWAEFSSGNLPEERIDIKITYLGETKRRFQLTGYGEKNSQLVEKLKKSLMKNEKN